MILQLNLTNLARNSETLFSWMPAYAGMTSFPRKRESSRPRGGQWPEEPAFFQARIMRSLQLNSIVLQGEGTSNCTPAYYRICLSKLIRGDGIREVIFSHTPDAARHVLSSQDSSPETSLHPKWLCQSALLTRSVHHPLPAPGQ
jgi:hypothetical protein